MAGEKLPTDSLRNEIANVKTRLEELDKQLTLTSMRIGLECSKLQHISNALTTWELRARERGLMDMCVESKNVDSPSR